MKMHSAEDKVKSHIQGQHTKQEYRAKGRAQDPEWVTKEEEEQSQAGENFKEKLLSLLKGWGVQGLRVDL